MSSDDRQVCMVDDMEGLSPLAEAYARARGKTCSKCHIITLLPLLFGCKIAFSISVYSLSVLRGHPRDGQKIGCGRQVTPYYRFICTVFWFKGPRKFGCLRQVIPERCHISRFDCIHTLFGF